MSQLSNMSSKLNDRQQQLSDEREKILQQFKENVKDCQLIDASDGYLVKWLIARNFNLEQAEKMLRQSLQWRKLNQVDKILEEWRPPEVMQKYFSTGQLGTDKFGCPLWISAQGSIDMRGIMQSATKKDLINCLVYVMEESCRQLRMNPEGCPLQKVTFITDMENLSMKQVAYKPAMDFGMEQAAIFEKNYPEFLRRIFIINAPKLYTVVFSMLRPLLSQETATRVRMYGCDKKEWMAALREDIDADQLPAYYGGTMVDPDGDPKCPSKFNMGGEVPRSYYFSNHPPKPKSGMTELKVSARSKTSLEYNVVKANSLLRWEFMTEGGDIVLKVFYQKDGQQADLLLSEKVESHLSFEEGQILCDFTGKYTIEFDNTHSYLTTKKVFYSIAVIVLPKE